MRCCVSYQPCWEQVREVILALCSALMKSHLECWVQFFSVQKGHGQTVQSPLKATKKSKELKYLFYEERNTLNWNAEFLLSLMLTCSVMFSEWYLSSVPHWASTFCREQWKVSRLCWKFLGGSLSVPDCCSERDNTGCNLDFLLAVCESAPKQTQKVYPTRHVSEMCS